MSRNNDLPQVNPQPNPKSRKSQQKLVRQRLAEAALGRTSDATIFAECVCGRQSATEGAYTAHIQRCAEYITLSTQAVEENRGRLAGADPEKPLVEAHTQQINKRPRLEATRPAPNWFDSNNLDVDYGSDDLHLIEKDDLEEGSSTFDDLAEEVVAQDTHASPPREHSRGKRKPKPIWLSSRYADYLPSSTVPFTIAGPAQSHPEVTSQPRNPVEEPSSSSAQPLPELRIRETAPNVFGLYKRFQTMEDQPHDPDLFATPSDLHDDESAPIPPPPEELGSDANPLHPFPNLSSGGKIGREKEEWVDDDGTAWVTGEVTIDVPLRSKHTKRGSIPYTINDFTYRPLMSVIRDKLSDAKHGEHFHYVPYELRWQPGEGKENVQVHGELYTSAAFLDEYGKLLKSPKEPGCDLPRYIVGLMFGSDATMLAQFGSAKAWPVYMFFGNDSKYRRCKPSTKLGEHIAFLEKLPDAFKDFYLEASGKDRIDPALLTHCERELFHAQWRLLLDDEFIEAYRHGIVVDCPDGHYPEKIVVASIRNLGRCPCPRCLIPLDEVHLMGQVKDIQNRDKKKRVDDQKRRRLIADARNRIYLDRVPVTSVKVNRLLQNMSLVPTRNAFSERLSPFGFDFHQMVVVDILHEVDAGVWKYIFVQLLRLLEAVQSGQVNELDKRYRLIPTFGADTIRRFRNNISEMKQLAARDFEDMLQCAIPVFEELMPSPHNRRIMRMLFSLAHWQALAKLRLHTSHTLALLEKWTRILGDDVREFESKTCREIATTELAREFQARQRRELAKAQEKRKGVPTKSTSATSGQNEMHSRATDEGGAARKGKEKAAMVDVPPPTPGPSRVHHTDAGGASIEDRRQSVVVPDPSESMEVNGTRPPSPTAKEMRRYKTLNLKTSKWHSFGDVVKHIKLFGTTDSYSTQLPELYHKFSKRRYKRTNKKRVALQLARIHMRQSRIARIRRRLFPNPGEEGFPEEELNESHFIGKSQNRPVPLRSFARGEADGTQDPAYRNFVWKLRKHLYPRVIHTLLQEATTAHANRPTPSLAQSIEKLTALKEDADSNGPSVDNNACHVLFQPERIYAHSRFVKNFTTYDLRRGQDVINPNSSRRNVMCIRDRTRTAIFENDGSGAFDAGSRFHYARVLGVYHANIIYNGPGSLDLRSRRFEFLWVRWYEHCGKGSWDSKQLDRLRFTPLTEAEFDPDTIGFLAPEYVLRGCHIIPRFAKGKVYGKNSRGSRGASKRVGDDEDYQEYYVNRFVDRDMVMRFHWGLGVGHVYSHDDAPPATDDMTPQSLAVRTSTQNLPDASTSYQTDETTGEIDRDKDLPPVPMTLNDGYDPTLDVDDAAAESTDSEVDPEFKLEDREALEWELEGMEPEEGAQEGPLCDEDWIVDESEESSEESDKEGILDLSDL
ncbi:hypothetical protein CC2G_006316 [Coprinopsis cinerea AmutBmut pab1-1]|nr:hypothetical protein CC2G_006316 [Coprinopsis cinerea AmutBmut pab1-1]